MKLLLTLIAFFSITPITDGDIVRKRISDDDFNYSFYIKKKKVSTYKNDKEYHWFKAGKMHTSFGGSDGHILHGKFQKTYISKDLAETGSFKNGVKNKTWKEWYQNGKLKKITTWHNGIKSGKYIEFDASGTIAITGRYKNNKKQGKWIFHKERDTLYYKSGQIKKKEETKDKKPKKSLKSFIHTIKLFVKEKFRKKTEQEKEAIKKEREVKKQKRKLKKRRKEIKKKNTENNK